MKKAIVTGITGQDGAYLAQHLLNEGYKVYGTMRRLSSMNLWRIQDLGIENDPNLELVDFDLTDEASAIRLIDRCEPDEVYNLAAQSFVGLSFEQPVTTANITGLGATNLLEAIRMVNPKIRFYQASTSEMFGKVQEIPRLKRLRFGRVLPMVLPSFMLIGLRSTIVRVTISLVLVAFSLTMNLHCVVLNL